MKHSKQKKAVSDLAVNIRVMFDDFCSALRTASLPHPSKSDQVIKWDLFKYFKKKNKNKKR